MHKDNYNLDVCCASEAALRAYSAGIECALRFDEPGIADLTEATAQDEDFALAHAVLGSQLQIHGFAAEATEHLHRSVALKAGTTKREQSAIDAISASSAFGPGALRMAQDHVAQYPQDVFVLSQIAGPFGLLAFSGQRDWHMQCVALLQATQFAYPENDWWHMTTRAFMAAEVGELHQAHEDSERAWSLDENGNCAHTIVHVQCETDAADESVAFIRDWNNAHGHRSDMRHHLMWHLALLHRSSGIDDALQIYARELDPDVSDPMPLTTFSDNASLLWRCTLSGVEIPTEICQNLVHYAESHYPSCGFAFADIHRVMSVAMLRDQDRRQALITELTLLAQESGTETATCMLEYAKGFNAFVDADYVAAATLLEPVNAHSVLLGGSNPQRGVVAETFLEARKRAAID